MRKHISEDGQVRNCNAKTPESCTARGPNGEKAEHFDSPVEAKQRSEELQEEKYGAFNTVQKKPSNKKYTQSELNTIAKDTDNPELIDKAINEGGKRVHNSLAKNNNISTEQINQLRKMYPNGEMDKTLRTNKNYPISELSRKEIARIDDKDLVKQTAKNDINDETAEIVASLYKPWATLELIKNPNNQLSSDMVNKLVAKDISKNYSYAKNNPKLNLNKILEPKTPEQLDRLVSNASDPVFIRAIHNKINEKNPNADQGYIANSTATPSDILDSIAQKPQIRNENSALGYYVYSNPNTSETTKKYLSENSPIVKSISKFDELEANGELNKLYGTPPANKTYKGTGTSYYFNPEEVKKAGLTGKDIDNFIRYKKKNYLFGASYDEETGTYFGYSD